MVINLYLGSKCNLNCAYCHREKDSDPVVNDEFFKGYDGAFICFKGGEPLVYMDTIQHILDIMPNSRCMITTNSKGIENFTDVIEKRQIRVSVSCDFDGGKARGYEPDFSKFVPNQIESVLYHGNINLIDKADKVWELQNKYGWDYTPYYTEVMHYTNDKNNMIKLTREDCDQILECWDWLFRNKHKLQYASIIGMAERYLQRHYRFGETRCVNDNVIRVDTAGNKYNCIYVRDTKVRSIEEAQKFIREHYPQCEHCPVYDCCGSACVQSKDHDTECYYFKNLINIVKKYDSVKKAEKGI